MDIKLPRWLLRKLVKRNPWLLSNEGNVRRALVLDFLLFELEIESDLSLDPKLKAQLQAERDVAAARD
ncbi:hypothetical protein G5B46_19810 [Caulobacter sp. 602-2]|uniref:Uncharacterized protein n=1 Tax=Caulobacter sp. 602-2 TaxID=2710887 RepID=A0A6G4R254_9CAUL|nr:hypothetical protein [Caulobacter sp. 602-2]NGM51862.1 hypothetical protein [Caulobacter sp. 602-2]